MTTGIVFQLETERVLRILASEIYDSPLSMLRENVQNAYDAIRMRFAVDGQLEQGGEIRVEVQSNRVVVHDNGIGMSEEVLRNNFWKAGSSGKRSEEARRAGVVGTFGIGAMANFGVATKLVVQTRALGSAVALRSEATRAELKLAEECISLTDSPAPTDAGTTLIADLDSSSSMSESQALQYLGQYVALLPVPVILNEHLISQRKIEDLLDVSGRNFRSLSKIRTTDRFVAADFEILADANGQVQVRVCNIAVASQSIPGTMCLLQSGGALQAYRSGFGLAPVPVAGEFQFGGAADIPLLTPTAGREALSRESVELVNRFVVLAERLSAEELSRSDYADRNTAVLSWIKANGRFDLCGGITVRVFPEATDVKLAELPLNDGRTWHYYTGTDKDVVSMFSAHGSALVQISQTNPRKSLQQQFLVNSGVNLVPDAATVLREFARSELDKAEASILIQIGAILREDYLVVEAEVSFATISHAVFVLPTRVGTVLTIRLARDNALINPLKALYEDQYDIFKQFMKDFVRMHIFPRIREFVPSSTREGAEALRKLLERNRELFRYEQADSGEFDELLDDFKSGASFADVVTRVRMAGAQQSQSVSPAQVGSVDTIVHEVVSPEILIGSDSEDSEPSVAPPILRDFVNTELKILRSSGENPQLNGYQLLLGLSDRLMTSESQFFRSPHSTRVVWAGHRVIYIFTDSSGRLSLYYDIELKNPLVLLSSGGTPLNTTTLITKSRIFVPVPDPLVGQFNVEVGSREFFVRFDVLSARER